MNNLSLLELDYTASEQRPAKNSLEDNGIRGNCNGLQIVNECYCSAISCVC